MSLSCPVRRGLSHPLFGARGCHCPVVWKSHGQSGGATDPQHLAVLPAQICRRWLRPPARIRTENISHKEQLLLCPAQTQGELTTLFFMLRATPIIYKTPIKTLSLACVFSASCSPFHLHSEIRRTFPQDSAGPFPRARTALAAPIPSCPLHASPAPAEERLQLMSLALGKRLLRSVIFIFLEPFSPRCLLLLQHQQH